MSNDYEEYEKACKEIRKNNGILLNEFKEWLSQKGLKGKTVEKHIGNADFYINTFLLHENAIPAREGADEIGSFLGYWFIRKAMWASPASIKSNAASLKKFYTFMNEEGLTNDDDLANLKERIKDELPEWTATAQRHDDPDVDIENVWGF